MASSGCSNTTSPVSIPYLFKGGRKKRTKSKRTKRKSKRNRKNKQRGGIGLFGDVASNAVTFSNSLTTSFTGSNSVDIQPAGRSYGNGNAYMV